MTQPLQNQLSRRERQIMDILYRLGEAGAAEVVDHLSDRPAYNSVRVTLGILERKGVVRHRREGTRYVYSPTVPPRQSGNRRSATWCARSFEGRPPRPCSPSWIRRRPGCRRRS